MRRQHKFRPEINLDKLWSLVGPEKFAELEKEKSTKAPVIDLVQFVSFIPYAGIEKQFALGFLFDMKRHRRRWAD